MFIYDYIYALLVGDRSKAFVAAKSFSDIIAMANRAFWLMGLSYLVTRAGIWGDVAGELEPWQSFAVEGATFVFGTIFPTLLLCQICFIAAQDVLHWESKVLQCFGLLALLLGVSFLGFIIMVSAGVVNKWESRRAEIIKSNEENEFLSKVDERLKWQRELIMEEIRAELAKQK